MSTTQFWVFSEIERQTVFSLLEKGRNEHDINDASAIISFDDFWKLFDQSEIAIMQKYLAIGPKDLDYKLPLLGLVDTPSDIVAIADQECQMNGMPYKIPCQYLPKATYDAYTQLNSTLHAATNKRLLVLYGYRSPARQVFMFFDVLQRIYDFDFTKTIQRICFPAYSEHVCPSQQAIDFITQDGVKGDGFETTDEYRWLCENAKDFGFKESYPRNNALNMTCEPWHWCFKHQ